MAPGYEALDRTATDLAAPPRPQFDGLWRHAKDGQTRRGFVALLAIAAGPGTDEGLDVPHAFLVAQGVLYAAAAGVAMLAPARVGVALRVDPPLDDDELAMLPFVGMALLIIAYMYAQGGRSNAAPAHFVAWSCAYRVLLVPPGTLGAYLLGGARPELCLTLGITEGVLGTLTCVAYSTAPLPPPALVISPSAGVPHTNSCRCLHCTARGWVQVVPRRALRLLVALRLLPGVRTSDQARAWRERAPERAARPDPGARGLVPLPPRPELHRRGRRRDAMASVGDPNDAPHRAWRSRRRCRCCCCSDG